IARQLAGKRCRDAGAGTDDDGGFWHDKSDPASSLRKWVTLLDFGLDFNASCKSRSALSWETRNTRQIARLPHPSSPSWRRRFLRWLGIRPASFAALPPFPVCDLARAALSRTLLGDPFGPHQQTRRRQPSLLTHFALPKMPRGPERGPP